MNKESILKYIEIEVQAIKDIPCKVVIVGELSATQIRLLASLKISYTHKQNIPFDAIVKELYRITKDGGIVVWVVNDATINGSETGTSFKQALKFIEVGFNLHDTMIFQKTSYYRR